MTKIFSIVLALALVSIITLAGSATVSAKGKDKEPIKLLATMFVTAPIVPVTNEHSGWSTIDSETLAGGLISVVDGPAILGTTFITSEQSSHEQFTSFDLAFPLDIKAIRGKSKGTFYLTSGITGGTLVVGDYDLKVSNKAGCQIWGEGKWKAKAKDSIIAGHGEISVCTNFVPAYGTFVASVTVTGNAALID